MNLRIYESAEEANAKAADMLAGWLLEPQFRTLMVAAGNTPLDLYARIAGKRLPLSKLSVFMLDEYVGVPKEEPRNCGNLLRRSVVEGWGIPLEQYFTVSSLESEAWSSIRRHEELISRAGGLDGIILGLGQNGHLGFNEPGSAVDSAGRLVELEKISVEANRRWFEGKYAPNKGVTVGLKTILGARRVMILAYGEQKKSAVRRMIKGAPGPDCPGSFLQMHSRVELYLDEAAAGELGD